MYNCLQKTYQNEKSQKCQFHHISIHVKSSWEAMTIETTAICLLSRFSCQNVHDWEQTQEHLVVNTKCSQVVKNNVFRGN
ncbi:hypothetical protein FOCC_FOCC012344 [Frankliniella occidentalis]|nr:hypothetical protein FOCC_FOCC012344 [Frankliniella occidentalis]